MRLEKTKKLTNAIHEIITFHGLNPDLFTWEETDSDFNTVSVEDRYGPLSTRQLPDTAISLAIKIENQPFFHLRSTGFRQVLYSDASRN